MVNINIYSDETRESVLTSKTIVDCGGDGFINFRTQSGFAASRYTTQAVGMSSLAVTYCEFEIDSW
jgi:hypothetical protein